MHDCHVRARQIYLEWGCVAKSVHHYGPYWHLAFNPFRKVKGNA